VVDTGPLDDATGPWLLAIECASQTASAALLRGDRLIGEQACEGRNHAETLLGLVDAVLGTARVSLDRVEAFAVSIGPGSFTSLRIGLATVKGLAFGSAARVAPVSTLAALAWEGWQARQDRQDRQAGEPGDRGGAPIAAALDARRGEVYGGIFRCDASERPSVETLCPEGLFSPQAFAELLPERCLLAGAGAELYTQELTAREGGAIDLWPGLGPTARAVGAIGSEMLARGAGVSAAELLPRYLRRAEAEELRLSAAAETTR